MTCSGVLALSLIVILAPSTIAANEVETGRETSVAMADSVLNIPIAVIRQTSEAAQLFSPEKSRAIAAIFKIPLTTLDTVGNLLKRNSKRRTEESWHRLRRDTVSADSDDSEEEEGRTFHRIKKKKHKFQHHKPSHYGLFGQPVLFPGHYNRPPAWKPPQAVPQFVNIFSHGNHGNHEHHKPNFKPHGHHQYQVWEEIEEDWPAPWSGGFFGLAPQYPFKAQDKVAPRREYRSYTTAPIRTHFKNIDLTATEASLDDETQLSKKDKIVFEN